MVTRNDTLRPARPTAGPAAIASRGGRYTADRGTGRAGGSCEASRSPLGGKSPGPKARRPSPMRVVQLFLLIRVSNKCNLVIVNPVTCVRCVFALTFCKGNANRPPRRKRGRHGAAAVGGFFGNRFRERALRDRARMRPGLDPAEPKIRLLFNDRAGSPRL